MESEIRHGILAVEIDPDAEAGNILNAPAEYTVASPEAVRAIHRSRFASLAIHL